ncbi:HPr family phosphocarrier protein [Caloramator proteoclasticus]|uniref:Phosphocarrier protein HPr n=1 Tax=Caloramator proteoclasticus DSM 10124 TaxID=1121262 RepID=A0A1M4XNT2_9CLOT|nr:HPr family phosphocarrier protein [Caloramator proteoclasticus]SHE95159.1 phosphocarrier protein [Caloramator proteoclasticus DSM 10124]
MKVLKYTFKTEMALHARPTTMIISEANKFKSDIRIEKDNINVNAKSLISVLSLVVEKGDTIKIVIEGSDEEEAYNSIKNLFESLEN